MCSRSLKDTIAEVPTAAGTADRITQVLEEARQEHARVPFDLLLQRARPASPESLAIALSRLVDQGLVERVVQVKSPISGETIYQGVSLTEIPDHVPDVSVGGGDVEVEPSMLRVIYRFLGS